MTTGGDRHLALEAARARADLTVQELWLRYVALSGTGDAFEIDGHLQGLVPLEPFQQDVLAQAVNERLEEVFLSLRVPLSSLVGEVVPDGALDDVVGRLLGPWPGPGQGSATPST
jgi:hypothetical protein